MGEQTDALVGVDAALSDGAAAAAAAAGRDRGGGFARIGAGEAQLGALLIGQTLLREGLIELDGGAVNLKHKGSCDLTGVPKVHFLSIPFMLSSSI